MNKYYLRHNKSEKGVVIHAFSFSVEKHLYTFYNAKDGKVIMCHYNSYNWDLEGIEYDIELE